MHAIFDVLRATLDEERLAYQVLGEHPGRLRFGFRTEQHAWVCAAEVRESAHLLILVGILPGQVAPARRGAVAEALMRLNVQLQLGNFELDLDDGQVRFRTSIDFAGGPAIPALVRRLLHANLATVARHAAFIADVTSGD